jgi:hypothetical protein
MGGLCGERVRDAKAGPIVLVLVLVLVLEVLGG